MGCVAAAQSPGPPADPVTPPKAAPMVGFRGAAPAIDSDPAEIPQVALGDPTTVGESQQEVTDLTDQKEKLGSELRYASDKLDHANKQLNIESLAGHAEEADKWQQEVNDWQARVKTLQAQLAEVNNEVQGEIQQMQPAPPENTLILPGDNLEVFVVEDPTFNGRYQVRRGGYIIMPAVGRIAVAGKTLPEAEAEVKSLLETSQLQHATVMVEKVEGTDVETGPVIYLYGEFRSPHPFRIPTGTKATVVNVILSCGGVTDQADLTRVKVMRVVGGKSVVEEEDVQKILDGYGLTSDLTLSDGDVIIVPATSANVVFVTGRVERPGSIPLKPGFKVSCYAAILQSGGFSHFADLKKVYVLRAAPDGTKIKIPVNILAVQHGRAPDLPLQGNDIIVVPEKFFSF